MLLRNRFPQNLVAPNSDKLLLPHTVWAVQTSRRASAGWLGLRVFPEVAVKLVVKATVV